MEQAEKVFCKDCEYYYKMSSWCVHPNNKKICYETGNEDLIETPRLRNIMGNCEDYKKKEKEQNFILRLLKRL